MKKTDLKSIEKVLGDLTDKDRDFIMNILEKSRITKEDNSQTGCASRKSYVRTKRVKLKIGSFEIEIIN